MTEDELNEILRDDQLLKMVDIKTLLVDLLMKHTEEKELVDIFYKKLPSLQASYVKRFIYMKRD